MKKLVSLLLIFLTCNSALADCDWTQIKKNTDNTYTYSEKLHLCVGQLVQDSATKDGQIADYKKAIELKDLAITKSDERAALWMDTSAKLEDRLNKIDELRSKNEWLYFALGGLTVLGAGFMASKLLHP